LIFETGVTREIAYFRCLSADSKHLFSYLAEGDWKKGWGGWTQKSKHFFTPNLWSPDYYC